MNSTEYHIDKTNINDYLIRVINQRYRNALIVLLISIPLVAIPIYSRIVYEDYNLGVLLVILVGFYLFMFLLVRYAISIFIKELKAILKTLIIISDHSISQKLTNIKEFDFTAITVIHKRRYGTIIVRGGFLTKIYYLSPNLNSFNPTNDNVLFIPSIINDYEAIIDQLVRNSNRAMKIGIRK